MEDTTLIKDILTGLKSGAHDPQKALELYKSRQEQLKNRPPHPGKRTTDVAVIGIAGRYPGARNMEAFWEVLREGKDCVTEIPPDRWDASAYYSSDPRAQGRSVSKWGGFIDGIDQFDAGFFNISPKEAELMDPQQRLFLQEAWSALEEAGYASADLNKAKCGVFVGCGAGDYYRLIQDEHIDPHAYTFMGNSPSILASRIAYFLNLRGATMAVDTACSSSLVALHLACEAIRSGDCSMALAGGVSLMMTPQFHLLSGQAGMLSPEGRCKAFDDQGNGFVPSEGVGVIVLKGLDQALRDGDHIHAVIRGSGINQDGKTSGITAPSAPSQADLMRSVYEKFEIDTAAISLIECHGTGTKLGDPIEIQGLTAAFGNPPKSPRAIGSVKSNIGHALTAAGIAGVTKLILCLKHQMLVPSIHVSRENRHIDFLQSGFYVNKELKQWHAPGEKLCACVSSFGFSGTNAHVVLEAPPAPVPLRRTMRSRYLIPLSAATEKALQKKVQDLRQFLKSNPTVELNDLAYTLSVGRSHFRSRVCWEVSSVEQLSDILQSDGFTFSDIKSPWEPQALQPNSKNPERQIPFEASDEDHAEYARQFLGGEAIDWKSFFKNLPSRRLSLPTYPFEQRRYWLPTTQSSDSGTLVDDGAASNATHSTTRQTEIKYAGTERFIRDHVVAERCLLPGMAYMGELLQGSETNAGMQIWDVEFKQAFPVESQETAITLSTTTKANSPEHTCAFTSRTGALLSSLKYQSIAPVERTLPILEIEPRCTAIMDHSETYQRFESVGIHYGPFFRVIQEMRYNPKEVLVRLDMSAAPLDEYSPKENWIRLLDGTLQSVLGLNLEAETASAYVPAGFSRLKTYGQPTASIFHAYATRGQINDPSARSFNIILADQEGNILAEIEELLIRPMMIRPANRTISDTQPEDDADSVAQMHPDGRRRLHADLAQLVTNVLKIPISDISPEDELSEYGFDSISLTELSHGIQDTFTIQLSPANLFEHPTLSSLADYLMREHADALIKRYPETKSARKTPTPQKQKQEQPIASAPGVISHPTKVEKPVLEPIAILGMAGRFPKCPNLDVFWEALVEGRDLISEVPEDRWDWKDFFGDPQKEPNKTRVNQGGFLSDVDAFDAGFFGISPREAELMDPQHRLFLEEVWHALEDASIRPSTLSDTNTGVFVGIASQDYKEVLGGSGIHIDAYAATGMAHCLAANRVSYLLNLHGPSEAIDTACSSSLVALHRAVESLQRSECHMAIAGGVNLLITPSLFISFDKAGMLSPDGRCKPFDHRANGYARGEGVGVVVLKRLSDAIRDRDPIQAVIRGSGVNHGGRANSLTAPNPNAQAALLVQTYSKAGIDPSSVSYMEAHGTGTILGDPIEFNGLNKAFSELAQKSGIKLNRQSCILGSVKSNVGHLETAAGISGLIKTVLALKHRFIPGTVHYQQANPHLEWKDSPFYISGEGTDWSVSDEDNVSKPRRAGVSSFGFGGTNAHVILEEWSGETSQAPSEPADSLFVVPLSARSEASLRKSADVLARHLQKETGLPMCDIAHTLQSGRESYRHRIAFLCRDRAQLIELLDLFAEKKSSPGIIGIQPGGHSVPEDLLKGEEANAFLEQLYAGGKFEQFARLWVHGAQITSWPGTDQAARRIHLPGYRFETTRFWYQAPETETVNRTTRLHPLVRGNTSNLTEQKYQLDLSAESSVFTDHMVAGKALLPAAAQLEIARFVGQDAIDKPVTSIEDFRWRRPVLGESSTDLNAGLRMETDRLRMEIWRNGSAGSRILFSEGYLANIALPVPGPLDLETIRGRCKASLEPAECYARFEALGVCYGPTFRVIQNLALSQDEAVADLDASQAGSSSDPDIQIQPELLDGAFQTVASLMHSESGKRVMLPHSMHRCHIWSPVRQRAIVHVVKLPCEDPDASRFDLTLANDEGTVLASIQGFELRTLHAQTETPAASDPDPNRCVFFAPSWQPAERTKTARTLDSGILIWGNNGRHCEMALPNANGQWEKNPLRDLSKHASEEDRVPAVVRGLTDLDPTPDTIVFRDVTSSTEETFLDPVECCQAWLAQHPKGTLHLIVVEECHPAPSARMSALAAFGRSLAMESSKVRFLFLSSDEPLNIDQIALEACAMGPGVSEVRFQNGKRLERCLEQLDPGSLGDATGPEFSDSGWYWITGGNGKLGMTMAHYMGSRSRATIVLSGRSKPTAALTSTIEALPGEVHYHNCDMTRLEEVRRLFESATGKYGPLRGVWHVAGVTQDGLFQKKSLSTFRETLEPKITGTLNLDQVIGNQALEFFVLFSSLAAVTGNPGQTDYGFANGFLDGFARQRQDGVSKGERNGRTLSINWPYWAEGGMRLKESQIVYMQNQLGMVPLEQDMALDCLERMWAASRPQLGVIPGDQEKILAALNIRPASREAAFNEDELGEQLCNEVLQMVGRILKIDPDQIELHEDLGDYGFDSISLSEFGRALNERFQLDLSPTLFFEHRSLDSFLGYLKQEHRESLMKTLKPETSSRSVLSAAEKPAAPSNRFVHAPKPEEPRTDDIAVIGMSGLFPQSPDLETFWRHLEEGRDLITEIPEDRWDWKQFELTDPQGKQLSELRYGGFVPGMDQFDAAFFGITPHEARLMDPQHRLFLQLVWHALEDAGIAPSSLAGSDTSLFVGVANFDYNGLIVKARRQVEAHELTGTAHSILANRISYLLDLHGPSEPVDTACSSSLVAIDRAIETLHSGKSGIAIAGGINALLSPEVYQAFAKAGMLSADGRCKAFDASANGYVRGEGGGVVVLKPLKDAVRDGHTIHAIIKASGVNHGGKAQSLTAPNPKAQADLLRKVYGKAGLPIESIGYIEAHGTGTPLGDPIELKGLQLAFESIGASGRSFCGVGTVKSNIGHLETAAGIAGVIKVILSLKHQRLPKTLHFQKLNPHAHLENSPFYVVDHARPWSGAPDPAGGVYPLRAGVSSFGFGGVNAHVVLEAHVSRSIEQEAGDASSHWMVLSAKTNEALRRSAARLHKHLTSPGFRDSLADVAFTLQTGRDSMRHRLAFQVRTIDECAYFLEAFSRDAMHQGLFLSDTRSGSPGSTSATDLHRLQQIGEVPELISNWLKGEDVDWKKLHPDEQRKWVSLPGYAFAGQSYWLPDAPQQLAAKTIPAETDNRRPDTDLLRFLTTRVSEITGMPASELDPNGELSELGLDSILGMQLLGDIERHFDLKFYPGELMEHNTLNKLQKLLDTELRQKGTPATVSDQIIAHAGEDKPEGPVSSGEATLTHRPLERPLLFLLSAPRSGSTLLRVMLNKHPGIYAPPELHLLPFENMRQRAEQLSGKQAFLKEGLIKALMELMDAPLDQARRLAAEWETQSKPVREVYRELQSLAGERLLVDKSPSYGMVPGTLDRASVLGPKMMFLHLIRHPLAVMESIVRNRFDKLFDGGTDSWAYGNDVWTHCNQNIAAYLQSHPNECHCRVRYEDLVRAPESELARLCAFLGIELDSSMLQPYDDRELEKGIHAVSVPIGDPNFNNHQGIESGLADFNRHARHRDKLRPATLELAESLGYTDACGERKLSPIQLEYLASSTRVKPWMIIQEIVVPFSNPDPKRLENALEKVVRKHDVLGWRFHRSEQSEWSVRKVNQLPNLRFCDHRNLTKASSEKRTVQLIHDMIASIESEDGYLFRCTSITRKDGSTTLLTVIHHLISDGVSMNLFHADLWRCYEKPQQEIQTDFSYQDFAKDSIQPCIPERAPKWWQHLHLSKPMLSSPDRLRGANDFASERTFHHSFTLEDWGGRSHQTMPLLLPALALSLGKLIGAWNQTIHPILSMRMHQRDGHDTLFHQVFGLFAEDVPFLVDLEPDAAGAMSRVREQLRHLASEGALFTAARRGGLYEQAHAYTKVRLNFQPIGPLSRSLVRSEVHLPPEAAREYELDFIVRASDEACHLMVRYSINRHTRKRIQQIMEELIRSAKDMIHSYQ